MQNAKTVTGIVMPKKYTIARLDKPKTSEKSPKESTTSTMTTSGSTCGFNAGW
jgi:hypothetical protein